MLTNRRIKFIRSLSERKVRTENRLFIAEGVKVVNDLIDSPLTIRFIYATQNFDRTQALKKNIPIELITNDQLKRISLLTTPNEVLALVEMPIHEDLHPAQIKNKNLLILDNINDPGNLGAMIRLAHWFGIDTIVASKQTVDIYNPKAIQASKGSFPFVKVYYHDLIRLLPELTQTLYAADLEGENLFMAKIENPFALILGSEAHGIDKDLAAMAKKIHIPSFSTNSRPPQSLNVSLAAAIILGKALGK